jgi:hypothetical protein
MYLGQELYSYDYDAPAEKDRFVSYFRHRQLDEVML